MITPEDRSRDRARLAAGYRAWLESARRESDAQRERRRKPMQGAPPYTGPERRAMGPPAAAGEEPAEPPSP